MSELIKLECMFYHKREPRHVKFLQGNLTYRRLRTLGRDGGLPEEARLDEGTNDYTAPIAAQAMRPLPVVGAKCVFCQNRVKYLPSNGVNSRAHNKCWQIFSGQMLNGK